MKTRFLHFACLITGLLFLGLADRAGAQVISIGPRVGVNSTSLTGLPAGARNSEHQLGYSVGGFARLKIPVLGLFVQPELLYSQTGGSYQAATGENVDFRLQSVDVPLLFGIQLVRVVRVYGGPMFGQTISSRYEPGGLGTPPEVSNSFRTGVFGVGANFGRFELDLRFFSRSNAIIPASNTRLDGFQLSAAYRLRAKRGWRDRD
jgi:hypothetical protein